MERVGGSCDVVVSLGVEQIKLLDQVQKKKKHHQFAAQIFEASL